MPAGRSQGGVAAVARVVGKIIRAIGRAFGLFRRSGDHLPEPESRKALLAEIVRLESMLDRVYERMARGTVGPGIDELVSQASQIREQLRQKRTRLSRLARSAGGAVRGTPGPRFDQAVQHIVEDFYKLRRKAVARASRRAAGIQGGPADEVVYEDEDESGDLEFESFLEGDH